MSSEQPEQDKEQENQDVSGPEPVSEGACDAPESNPDVTDSLRAEVASLKDALLRAQAEMENVRRRSARDVENAHKYAIEKFASELLPVADSLEKSVETARSAVAAAGDEAEAAKAIAEGVELSLKLFIDTLGKGGIERIDPMGHPFDPEQHEAMAMVENPDAEPNSVIEVMQKGYSLNGRLVRAAMVVVAKTPGS